jgi:hypothetical protein
MIAIRERTSKEGVDVHSNLSRVYEGDGSHGPRIIKAREYVSNCPGAIVELGCGTGDICGPFSRERDVRGYDCSAAALCEARGRFPKASFYQSEIDSLRPRAGGVLVMCEFLEHINDPIHVAQAWLPCFEFSVISHPLNEIDLIRSGIDLSGGEHVWSYDTNDFTNWFAVGNHELVQSEVFQMGSYKIIIGRGVNKH